MKSYRFTIAVLMFVMILAASAFGLSARRPPVSLLVVPARYTVIQVSRDIVGHRPAVLVSYRDGLENGRSLYVWDGSKWIPISRSDFESMNFVRTTPAKIVFVGPADNLSDLIDAVEWCDEIEVVENMQTTALLNRFGKIFGFSAKEWNWFARRYGCELNVTNKQELEGSWYDQKGSEFLEREQTQKIAREVVVPEADVVDRDRVDEDDYDPELEVDEERSISIDTEEDGVDPNAIEAEVEETDSESGADDVVL